MPCCQGTLLQLADTDMQNKEKREHLEHRIPMGQVGRPEYIAGPAVFLASKELSGFMTGLTDAGRWRHVCSS